jgi:protein-disulfide isomerase
MAAKVERDIAFGKELQVNATPTLFINGQRVSGYRPEEIRTLIREQAGSQ